MVLGPTHQSQSRHSKICRLDRRGYSSSVLLTGKDLNGSAIDSPASQFRKSVFLEWNPPSAELRNGLIQSYIVTYYYNDTRLVPSIGNVTNVTVGASTPSVTIDGRIPIRL